MSAKELLEAALQLEPRDREFLVEHLIESLMREKSFALDAIERAWMTEIQRRSAEVDAGTAELVDWSEVRSRIAARRAPS